MFFFSELDFRHTLGGAHFPKKRADNLPVLEKKCLADCEFEKKNWHFIMVYGLNYVNVPGMSESGCTFLDPPD